jgi:hypothetical protein
MQDTNEEAETTEDSAQMEAPSIPGKQSFVGILVAAAVLITVMLLMLLAVRHSRPTVSANSDARPYESESVSPRLYGRHMVIDHFAAELRTSVAGTRGLAIRGYVRNTGKLAVGSADLKCVFRTKTGTETSIELPLIIDSKLDEVSDGPLMPLSGREFGLRIGEFPLDLEPEIVRMEPVNVRVLTEL